MDKDLFKFSDYRSYLRQEFAGKGVHRGRRRKLAEFIGCQSSYISQILTDRTHLSLEHSIKAADFLSLNALERKYFMLLVQKERAGTKDLETYFNEEIIQILRTRNDVKERINIKTSLSSEDQMTYYSSWYYSAIHILSAFPEFNSPANISAKLRLDLGLVKKVLSFLEERAFVKKIPGGYCIGSTRIHLGKGAPMLPRHHANWRMRAIESLDHERSHELHYSAVLGISRKDIRLFKERLLQVLQEFEPIVESSKVEEPVALLLDLFSL